jgi:hypothetical protein
VALRQAIAHLQPALADYPLEQQIGDLLQPCLLAASADILVRLRANILAHIDETRLCPALDVPLDVEQSLLAALFRKVDGQLGYRRIAEPLTRLIEGITHTHDVESRRGRLYDFSDWLAVILESGSDWTEPIARALYTMPDQHIERLAAVLSHLPDDSGATPYRRLSSLLSPRTCAPRQSERDARIPALLCRALTRCMLDRLDDELNPCAEALRQAARTGEGAGAALQELMARLEARARFGAHHLIPPALLEPYCDGLLAKALLLAGPQVFDRYRKLLHKPTLAHLMRSDTHMGTGAAPGGRARRGTSESEFGSELEPMSEPMTESASSVSSAAFGYAMDSESAKGVQTIRPRFSRVPGPRQEAILRSELCRVPEPQRLLPLQIRNAAGAVQTLSFGRQFIADAIERPSVSFSVSGVAADGTAVMYCRCAPGLSGALRAVALLDGISALHRLAGDYAELLTRIMTQQTSGALCAALQQLGAESPIRMADGVALIPGGSASLHFDVVRRPDGCFRIDATIHFPRMECGTRVYEHTVESAQLDPARSYFRASFGLLLYPSHPRLDLIASVGFDYALVPSDQTQILGMRV